MRRDVDIALHNVLALKDVALLAEMNSFGASAGAMVSYAAMAV
jgi:hypothetical protein